MDSLRRHCVEATPATEPCSRCGCTQGRWDRLGTQVHCPRCEEALMQGEIEAVREAPTDQHCAVCGKTGTLAYMTFPLHSQEAIELDLCGEHLRSLLSRDLAPHAFHQLRRLLGTISVQVDEVFLLHDAFYNKSGRSLKPIA